MRCQLQLRIQALLLKTIFPLFLHAPEAIYRPFKTKNEIKKIATRNLFSNYITVSFEKTYEKMWNLVENSQSSHRYLLQFRPK